MSESGRVVVTGATGLLGRALLKAFLAAGWETNGWGFTRADGVTVRKVDITSSLAVSSALDAFTPDIVVHAAAERHPDVIEANPELAHALNVDATRFLADACAERGVKMIFISTDYVFDGTSPPYSESATPNPLNAYGASKLAGETATMASSSTHAVLRVPILFGPVETLDESAVTVLFKCIRDASQPARLDDVQRRYPTHVAHVAEACLRMARLQARLKRGDEAVALGDAAPETTNVKPADLEGLFHFSGAEVFTKLEMGRIMAESFKLPSEHFVAVGQPEQLAASTTKRPMDARLSCERLESLGLSRKTDFRNEIKVILEPFLD